MSRLVSGMRCSMDSYCTLVGSGTVSQKALSRKMDQMCEHLQRYLVCQFREVLPCVADNISHSKDRAVDVLVHVKVAFFDVIISDGGKEVPSVQTQRKISAYVSCYSIIIAGLLPFPLTWCS